VLWYFLLRSWLYSARRYSIGNDELIAGVNVITRSMTAAQAAKNDRLASQATAPEQSELINATEADKTSEDNSPDSEILSV